MRREKGVETEGRGEEGGQEHWGVGRGRGEREKRV